MKLLPSFISIASIILISSLLISCGGGGGGSSSETISSSDYASLSISLGTTTAAAKAAAGSAQLPDDITRCVVTCSGPGMTAISADLPLDGSPFVMNGIPPGNNRIVAINAYNDQLLRMAGTHTIASLQAGTTTSVSIQLTDVAVMIISLDPITDMASATDTDYAQVYPSTSLQLYCGVSNHVDTSVTWHVDGIENGSSSVGAISSSGLYSAPTTIGSHTIQAVSNEDPTLTDSITIAVTTAPPDNIPPTANAGTDSTVLEGTNVNLVGSGSTDSDGTIASYHWVQIVGTTVTLNDADSADPLFIAPDISTAETLTFELTVTDDDGATDSDSVSIIVQPSSGSFTVSPKIVHVLLGESQQFTATDPDISWEINGVEGGNNTTGTITQDGLYSSPDSIATNPYDISIEGVDTFDPTNSDFAKLAVVEETTWHKTYSLAGFNLTGSTTHVSPSDIDGNSIFCGGFKDSTIDSMRLFHLELNSEGGVVRQKQYQMPYNWFGNYITPIKAMDNGFLIAIDDSASTGILNHAIDLVKLDSAGELTWAYQYAIGTLTSTYPCYFRNYVFEGAVAETASNYIIGWSDYTNNECNPISFSQHLHFYITDKNGTLTHHISMIPFYQPGTDNNTAEMYITDILPTADGGFLAAVNVNVRPNMNPSHQRSAPLLIKINSDFSFAWCRQFSESLDIKDFTAGETGEFFLTVQAGSLGTILKIAEDGTILAQGQLYTQSGDWLAIDNVAYDDETLLLSGSFYDGTYSHADMFLLKTDTDFTNIQWQLVYGNATEGAMSAAYANNGYYSVSGAFTKDAGQILQALRVPSDTGLIAGVSKIYLPELGFPADPQVYILTSGISLITTTVISANYVNEIVNGAETSPLTLTEISIPPTFTIDTITGLLPTMAIARSPDSSSIGTYGQQMKFYASLSHLVTDTAVTWSVNGIEGGNTTVGTISADGTYTSPDSIPDPDTVLIRATSVEEPSLSAEITLTIQPGGG